MRHLDLFSGIGGFALAARWAGIDTVAFCEINEWCHENALLPNFPEIPNLRDIKTLCRRVWNNLDETGQLYEEEYIECSIHGEEFGNCPCVGADEFTDIFGHIDIITAGVPCQPASIIGKRKGVADSRWLWPDTFRVIREVNPAWVICEQPTGILSLDNGERFAEIVREFQEAGYSVWWETIPASAVGAGHRRERVWITAYASSKRLEGHPRNGNTHNRQERKEKGEARPATQKAVFPLRDSSEWWRSNSPVPIVVDGVPDKSFWKEAVIATGNAIVPQVAYSIMKEIAFIHSNRATPADSGKDE